MMDKTLENNKLYRRDQEYSHKRRVGSFDDWRSPKISGEPSKNTLIITFKRFFSTP